MQHASALDWIKKQKQVMLDRTLEWSAINSGSLHLAGLTRMREALAVAFSVLGAEPEVLNLEENSIVDSHGEAKSQPLGKALRFRKHANAPLKIFLGGHMDTVFGEHHTFQTPQFIDDNTVNGPGVADLKGGLSVMLTALQALEQSEHAGKIGWEILINPDEEIGSPGSRIFLEEAAKRNHLGLIYEPALADGTLAGARKGSGNFTVVARGKAAHVGRAFHEGKNAIAALARLIIKLDNLNGKRAGLIVNVGKVEGGGPVNIVPDFALLKFNVRVDDTETQNWFETEMRRFLQEEEGLTLHGAFGRPPKHLDNAHEALFGMLKQCGEELKVPVAWKATGGCCDGNNLAGYGLPNVDTLGVRGGNLHTDQEFMVVESLVERASLSALLLLKLASGELVWPA